ncbi:MAG: Tetratricopeptide repeat protein [Myxococcales bacterium]|nr:Tetratricopeptide repeat protein [Myxococcales bacterium]
MSKLKLAILTTLLVGGSAWAQKAKYTRNSDVKVNVTLSDRVKPIQQKPQDKSEFKPELNADQVLSIEGLVSNIRNEQEQILAQLIDSTPDTEVEEKSDYYFRLGELYAKQQRLFRLKTAEAQIAVDKAKTPQQKAQLTQIANKSADTAKMYLLKAVKTYKGLTDNDAFRNYPKMDMALFYYGYTLQGGKYMKEARAVYDKLLKNYPQSKYVPEAHLAFADFYFEQGQLDDAEARYKMVLKFPKSTAYWYAMYKMGWIHLNKQRFQDALETFFQVASATKNDKKQEVLNRAAKKDFVRAYAEIGKADKAYDAFKRVDQKFAFDMLAILADLYLEQGKSDKAIYVYRELMKQAPTNKNVCLWQYNVAHASLSMPGANNADKVAEIENLVRLWGVLKGKKVLPAAEGQECHDNAAAMSGELARAYHSESAKTKNPETLAYAEKLYKVYLDVFTDAEDYAQTQYFYAELVWSRAENEKNPRLQTELWENAAVAFTDVVKQGKVEPKVMKESAYAAVLGWKNALNVDPRVKQQVADEDPKNDKKPEPKPIPEREQKMLAAFDIYINYIKDPKDDELVGMKFLKANIYRRYNHFDEAFPIFMDILEHHREHETAEYSANLVLDSYNRQQKYDELLALADKLSADKKFMEGKDDLKATLDKIKATAARKAAEKLEREAKEQIALLKGSKDYSKLVACGNAYLEIYNRNPTAPDNDEVLYNAGVCFADGKSIGASIAMFNLLEKYYPKSKITARAVARLGKAYGDIAFYDRASDKLEQYAKQYAGEKDAYDAMSDAVFYRKGIGDDDKAIADTAYFIKTFGTKKLADAANADFSLTTVYEKHVETAKDNEKANAQDQVIKHLREYLHQFGDKGGADRAVIAHVKIGQILFQQSCPVKEVDGACVKIVRERATAAKKVVKKKKGKETYVAPLQCGPESKIKLTVVKRDERKLRDALGEFKQAAQVFEKHQGKTGGDEGGARYYYGLAKFAEADVEYEKYLDIKFPQNLNFGDGAPEHKAIKEKAQKRFNDWLEGKTKSSVAASAKYAKVLEIKDAANSIAAAARLGQISQEFSDQLFTAEIPKEVRATQMIEGYDLAQDKVDAYCDALTTAAEPLAARSLEAYGVCLSKSTELGWFSEWSKLCEKELGQIKPEEFPTASELRGDPTEVTPIIAPEPPAKLD